MSQQDEKFGSPYTSGWAATSEHYHAVRSLNEHGAILHTCALAQQIIRSGGVQDEWQALDTARAQVQAVRQVVDGQRLNQQARRQLDAEAAERKRNQGGILGGFSLTTL